MINAPLRSPASVQDCFSSAHSLQVGVLTNPLSGGNKKGLGEIHNVLAKWPAVMQREASTPENIRVALADFARSGVELVVINGGDGTIQAALTTIGREHLFDRPPLLALLCAGTTSMLPRDVGINGPPAKALSRILEWAESPDASLAALRRPILQINRVSPHEPLFGMFFGSGAICQGIKLFHSKDNPMGWRGEWMPVFTMFRLLLAILSGNQDKVPPFLANIRLDHHPVAQNSNLFVLVSTLERLFLGMHPYWGTEDGPLRYTAIASRPKKLLRVAAALLRAKTSRHATPENGYLSHNASEVQLFMTGEFNLDGELYEAGDGPVTITPAEPAVFLCPPRP